LPFYSKLVIIVKQVLDNLNPKLKSKNDYLQPSEKIFISTSDESAGSILVTPEVYPSYSKHRPKLCNTIQIPINISDFYEKEQNLVKRKILI
jgi:hypothetical protein